VVPTSLKQDSSRIATAAAAVVQVDRCLPALALLVPYHLSLPELIENAAVAAAVAVYSEGQRTVALTADRVGNFEVQAVGNAVDLATAGYWKG